MPTYEYRCNQCGNRFEKVQRMTSKPVTTCPRCGNRKAERLLSAGTGLVFKGSGFYLTDYGRAGQAPKKSEGESSSPGEKPAEAKPGGDKPAKPSQPKDD